MAEKCSILFQFRVYLGRVEQKERKKMLFRNIKGGNILGNSYKICFLGYRKLREMAQQVIDKLNYQDTTVVMKECAIETLEQVVNEADSEGCQVFVAGSANAEEFKQRFSEHLVELHIDMSDYVYCLCRARDMGARRVGVTIYRKSRQMNFEALQELAGIPIEPIYFESEPELTYLLEHTSCDCVIGASLTVEVAERLGLPCILIYDGEYTIRTSDHAGLFELAGNGTIVLQGLGGASESFFACLRQVLVYHSFFSVGGTTLKVFQARIITLLEPEEAGRFPRELREMLSVFSLTLPPLRERGDDVIELFRIFAVREAGTVSLRGQKELWKELDELLRFYAWPTNLITLSAVVKRYVYLYRQAMNPSPGVKRQLLIKAIGEDELLEQLRQEYPALQDPAGSTPEAIVEGVAEMKRLLKYNDNTIADKLGFGRTTLWRMQKKSGAAKAKKEE